MIKLIKRYQIKLTPFDATKNWEMSTTNNQNLLLHDTGSYIDPEVPVALEFIDFRGITDLPILNYDCNIALEKQDDDLVETRVGLKNSGLFFPETEPVNEDGTYKRVVYSQIRTMFYNNYKDPTKTWGINNIDFNLSKTQRKISDEFRLFDVPHMIYGDKIIPNSIAINDRALDTDYTITDDGNGNLIAGTNLFSKQQELGKFYNVFEVGRSNTCDNYFSFISSSVPTPPSGSILLSVYSGSSVLIWTSSLYDTFDYYGIQRSINGILFTDYTTSISESNTCIDTLVTSSVGGSTYWYRIAAVNTIGTSSFSNTASITFTSPTSSILYPLVLIEDQYIVNPIQYNGYVNWWIIDETFYPTLPVPNDPHIYSIYADVDTNYIVNNIEITGSSIDRISGSNYELTQLYDYGWIPISLPYTVDGNLGTIIRAWITLKFLPDPIDIDQLKIYVNGFVNPYIINFISSSI